ncbi:MAG: hypothetical protein U0Y68_05155 [Blastocatellia bacterium]
MMRGDSSEKILQQYLREIRDTSSPLRPAAIKYYAEQASSYYLEHARTENTHLSTAVELLCEINHLQDPLLSRIGLEALFPNLIEKLNDSFDPILGQLYDRLFIQVISFCRKLPEYYKFDRMLNLFGLPDEGSLLARKASLTTRGVQISSQRPLKKILFLSRVTIGADVAITSVFISHLKKSFPTADIVLVGPPKLAQLYGGDPRLTLKPVHYGRHNSLLSRLLTWLEVVSAVEGEIKHFNKEEFIIVDPDSRLTQLGLLPIIAQNQEPETYFHFPSRYYSVPGIEKLGELASRWVNQITNGNSPAYPYVCLSPESNTFGRTLRHYFHANSSKPIVCLSFGTGGNTAKRISLEFEVQLAQKLAENCHLILDSGLSPDEFQQAHLILQSLKDSGLYVLHAQEGNDLEALLNSGSLPNAIGWIGGIGSFASIVANSHQYIGYDSSGQHLASALNIPSVTIFVNSGSSTFAKRWHPTALSQSTLFQFELRPNLLSSIKVTNLIDQVYQLSLQNLRF